jgi:hypothetical protein
MIQLNLTLKFQACIIITTTTAMATVITMLTASTATSPMVSLHKVLAFYALLRASLTLGEDWGSSLVQVRGRMKCQSTLNASWQHWTWR